MNPPEMKYSEEHEWVKLESDNIAIVGITEFAAESLGDVVFIELPDTGTQLTQFGKMGEIESVKAVSDLYAPLSGTISERNDSLLDHPELVNESAFDSGWMIKVDMSDASEIDKLMSAEQYDAFLASQD